MQCRVQLPKSSYEFHSRKKLSGLWRLVVWSFLLCLHSCSNCGVRYVCCKCVLQVYVASEASLTGVLLTMTLSYPHTFIELRTVDSQ